MTQINIFKCDAAEMTDEKAARFSSLHSTSFSSPWSAKSFQDMLSLKSVSCWVAKQNHNADPIGYIIIQASKDEAEILTLVVDPSYRRGKIAMRLYMEMSKSLIQKNIKNLFLEVDETNIPAVTLYNKLGFERIGQRKAYYGASENSGARNALILRCELLRCELKQPLDF